MDCYLIPKEITYIEFGFPVVFTALGILLGALFICVKKNRIVLMFNVAGKNYILDTYCIACLVYFFSMHLNILNTSMFNIHNLYSLKMWYLHICAFMLWMINGKQILNGRFNFERNTMYTQNKFYIHGTLYYNKTGRLLIWQVNV